MRLACASLVAVGAVVAVVACAPPDKGELVRAQTTRATLTSFESAGVGAVFEKHCGSLDCHGTTARNLRIYSANGLRLPNDAGLLPGQGDTTHDERLANYHSILSLEPEATNRVLEGGDPYTLLVLRKPLQIESHKGGQPIRRGDDAERCIVTWLEESPAAPVDGNACTLASAFPKE